MDELNPRSYASIKKAMAERRAKSRGQLARQMVDAFRGPLKERKELEAAVKAEENKPKPKAKAATSSKKS